MGLRFDLQTVNWIAYLTVPGSVIPPFRDDWTEQEAIQLFLSRLRDEYLSSPETESSFRRRLNAYLDRSSSFSNSAFRRKLLDDLRAYFRNRSWTALIVPSGQDTDSDRFLCSKEFLRELVQIRPDDPGLILQPEEAPQEYFTMMDVFPAFRTALAKCADWPGILLWTRAADSMFLPLPTMSKSKLEAAARWIFSHLASSIGIDLELLEIQYRREFPEVADSSGATIHFVQLSDLHLGCREADQRLPRVQQLIRNIIDELGNESQIVPVVSGDLMDSPNRRFLDKVRAFMDFLGGLGTKEPVIILGNHDVRKWGFLRENYKTPMSLPTNPSHVEWFDDLRVGLVCFNSVVSGRLATGFIGEEQLLDRANEIERKKDWREYTLLAALHHHPISIEVPSWYVRPFYERILGDQFEKTEALEDAESFIKFAEQRRMSAILHGHKHIPHISKTPNVEIPIYGCGSTVGKVSTYDGGTYMSVNVISLNVSTRHLSGRLLAERIPGGGLVEEKRHEVICKRAY
jgi:hypothetical protein